MKNFIFATLTAFLIIGDTSTITNGQATVLPIQQPVPVTNDSLDLQISLNRDTISKMLKVVSAKPLVKYRYIRTKPKKCTDTLWMPIPEDSLNRIVKLRIAKMKTDTVYIPVVVRDTVKKKRWLSRIF